MNELQALQLNNLSVSDHEKFLHILHDIRSPLTVLKILLSRLKDSPEGFSHELIAEVFERVESIVEGAMRDSSAGKPRSLAQAIHAVLSEKSVQHGKAIQFQSCVCPVAGALAIEAREFMRFLSNLINNSVKAGATFVQVEARRSRNFIDISVSDDGFGFSPSVLADLESGIGRLGANPGRGFGLRHAQCFAASVGGRLCLRSLAGQGSSITVRVPYETEY